MKNKQRVVNSKAASWAIAAALFGLAWGLRAWGANAFVTWDEPAWTYRSARFLLALGDGRLRDTLQTGHPGVLTMWSGALGLLWHRLVTGNVSQEALRAVQSLPELDIHDATTLRLLGGLLPYAKSGILPLYALLTGMTYLILDRLLPRGAAVLASLLLLLEPYHLALTRVLHIDGLTASCMLISTLALLVWQRDRRTRWVFASGSALAMAALTKSYAIMGAPVGLALILLAPRQTASTPWWRQTWSALWRWGLAAAAAFALLWPSMWVSPRHVIMTMFDLAFGYATAPGDATTSFFMGTLTETIGWTFYPVVLTLRTTPTTLAGLALALAGLVAELRHNRTKRDVRLPIAMLALAIGYLALVSLGAKKYDRYVLPALVALDVLAAWGYLAAWRWLSSGRTQRGRRVLAPLAFALVAGTCGLWVAPYGPSHYLAHYSVLAGGPRGAAQVLPLGWGEGVEIAADYLASQPNADDLHVASWAVAGLAPKLPGTVTTLDADHLPDADYVVFTIGDMQTRNELAQSFAETHTPSYVAQIAGQPYAWVFANAYGDALAERLADGLYSGDMIITDLPSTLERHHGDALPIVHIAPMDEDHTAAALRQAAIDHGAGAGSTLYRIRWIDDGRANPLQWQVEQNAVLEHTEPIPYGEVQVYRLIDEPDLFQTTKPQALPEPAPQWDVLALTSAGLAHDTVRAGQRIGVSLVWEALAPPDKDYQLFLHLVDDRGIKWGQRDLALANVAGDRTKSWAQGSLQTSRATVPLQPGIVPGWYSLLAGLYRWQDGQAIGAPAQIAEIEVLPGGTAPDLATLGLSEEDALQVTPGIELLDSWLGAESARTGETVDLWLTWRCTEEIADDWRLQVELLGETNGTYEMLWPTGDDFGPSQWRPGDVYVYPVRLHIDEQLTSGRYTVTGALTRWRDRSAEIRAMEDMGPIFLDFPDEHVRQESGVVLDLGSLDVERIDRHQHVPSTATPIDVRLSDEIVLVGFELASSPPVSAEDQGKRAVSVSLYWQALSQPSQDWTVFIHVLDEDDILRGQVDTQPALGTRPTSGWIEGEIIWDSAHVRLDEEAQPGVFHVAVGMYDAATLQRAPATDAASGPLADDRLVLPATITVK